MVVGRVPRSHRHADLKPPGPVILTVATALRPAAHAFSKDLPGRVPRQVALKEEMGVCPFFVWPKEIWKPTEYAA
jgi:hypothetical protein